MALEITIHRSGPAPVWTLCGRFDAAGADGFDRRLGDLSPETRHLILDLRGVSFLSSAGIRSLLKSEKIFRQRSGGVVLAGATEFVSQTLAMSGLLPLLRAVPSVAEAERLLAGTPVPEAAETGLDVNGRSYTLVRLPESPCFIETWGEAGPLTPESVSAGNLVSASLEELGLSFGLGGLGNDRAQAAEALGLFLATGRLAAVLPADGSCFPDYLRTDHPADARIHLVAAAGISGRPAMVIQGDPAAVSMVDFFADLLQLVESRLGRRPPLLGLLLEAESVRLAGSFFRRAEDIVRRTPETMGQTAPESLALAGILLDVATTPDAAGMGLPAALRQAGVPVGNGFLFFGHAVRHHPRPAGAGGPDEREYLKTLDTLDDPLGVVLPLPETVIRKARAWVYLPAGVRPGPEKRLRIELSGGGEWPDEWDAITRRIYTDSSRIVLSRLTGGYSAVTFRVTGYDPEGRRMLPTVLKISSLAFTDREEAAYHRYVEKFILNNSTVIMGRATRGQFAGLRYNFLGITGEGDTLSWLADHYARRPVEELTPLLDTLFSRILKPWYGQPKAETVKPYSEHDPQRLFPTLLDDAARHLGLSADAEVLPCPELGLDLPNPYHFLKHGYAARRGWACPWYTSIIHGDLNLNNVLLDEKENLYVIDFSETRSGDITSDFARLESLLRMLTTRLENTDDLVRLLEFELGLAEAGSMAETPRLDYRGSDPMVTKAYRLLCLLRRYADRVTLFEEDLRPYLVGVLEWIYPIVCFRQVSPLQLRLSACSAGIIVRQILRLEGKGS